MKILVAKTAGFCMGVRRAVDLAIEYSPKDAKKLCTHGPLIHNQQTIDMLKDRGIDVFDPTKNNPTDSVILTRAHGVPPQTVQELKSQGFDIIGGTCPKVKAVQKTIEQHRRQGFSIVITGDQGHAEVVGLLGYAGENGHLIQSVGDVSLLPHFDKVCLVSQTTFDQNTFDEIANAMNARFGADHVVVKKTICSATEERQIETEGLAKQVSAMIVVGGKHSANTLRLAGIAQKYTPLIQHVETEQEINWEPLSQCKKIGVTAGASTPNWMIKRVVDHLHFLDQTQHKSFKNIFWQVIDVMVNLNCFVAAGAVMMYYTSCVFQHLDFSPVAGVIVFLYFLSMHLWNSITSTESMRHLGLSRYRFYRKHKTGIFSLTIAAMLCLLLLSFLEGKLLFLLTLFSTLGGIAYHFSIVPKFLRGFVPWSNLKDIPTSRDLFAALAWAVLITFVPQAMQGFLKANLLTVFLFVAVFLLAYLRSLNFDLRDIEGDRIMGRETLVTIVGERGVKKGIFIILWVSFGVLIFFSLLSLCPQEYVTRSRTVILVSQMPVLFYIWLFMKSRHVITVNRTSLFNILADGQFFVAGLGAWVAQMFL